MQPAERDNRSDPRSILVVLPTWVGDFVMATPILRAIRRRFAGAHITFLAEPNLLDLIRGSDWMNDCVEWPARDRRMPWHREFRGLAANLRARRLDLAVLLPNSTRSALIAYLAKAKRRIGYDRDGRRLLLTDPVAVKNRRRMPKAGRNADPVAAAPTDASPFGLADPPAPPGSFMPVPLVEYYADLAEAVGCERPGDRLELFTTPDCEQSLSERLSAWGVADRRPLVVISPGAKYGAAKCWLPERFAGVADRLISERDAAVVVTCGPGEESIARTIGAAMKHPAVVTDEPLLTLGELKSLVARCDLLICNDAGPRHFAKAFDVPVVTIFGPTHPRWTATSYRAERIARIDVECGPCQKRVCPLAHLDCMTGVSEEMVLSLGLELLDSQERKARVVRTDG